MSIIYSHPAVAIPIKKKIKHVNLIALVVGCMSPDFEYFFRLSTNCNIGHTILGCVFLNIPLSILIAYLFFNVVKNPFISNLPGPLSKLFSKYKNVTLDLGNYKNILDFSIWALIGMATHLIWDSFTTETGFFVVNTNILTNIVPLWSRDYFVYEIVEVVLGISAIIYMIVVFVKGLENSEKEEEKVSTVSKLIYWGCVFILTGFFFIFRVFSTTGIFSLNYVMEHLTLYAIILNSGFVLSIFIVSMFFNIFVEY